VDREIDPALLRKLLRYDAETGKLYWLVRTPDLFAHSDNADADCRRFNTQFAGKEAMYADSAGHGYCTGAIFNRQFLTHRVIWALVHGEWPIFIDHINGIRTDNRLCNLRSVSRQENMRNARRPRTNKSGVIGVYWASHASLWRASIKVNGKNQHLGYFKSLGEAAAARTRAEREIGFHPNHGRAA